MSLSFSAGVSGAGRLRCQQSAAAGIISAVAVSAGISAASAAVVTTGGISAVIAARIRVRRVGRVPVAPQAVQMPSA